MTAKQGLEVSLTELVKLLGTLSEEADAMVKLVDAKGSVYHKTYWKLFKNKKFIIAIKNNTGESDKWFIEHTR